MIVLNTINKILQKWLAPENEVIVTYRDTVTLELCTNIVKQARKENHEIELFTLSVVRNEAPKNNNDKFIVTISFMNKQHFPINGGHVFHAGKVDEDFTELLRGRESVTLQILKTEE
ncbi:MAG: hypothetical protein IJG34_05805 [Synergistaceae bacterium]|nr:hypothetical protein [Synergistaceae bacterium]MBQ3449392.1 hypothetical protein [Synergistaceae bacterium]MBQ3695018.1 hypothetical protein [Synergistaceae bacterium]MBQ6111414.1 hypothetical protein [Synergistaceae bacterium]MBQ9628834.1 hypothetical protein [Synergistaceae bacterium]